MAGIEPLPEPWRQSVLSILEKRDAAFINWTLSATQDSDNLGLGMSYEKLDYLIRLFQTPGLMCLPYPGMEGEVKDIRAVLGPHPADVPVPVYVKIGFKLVGTSIKIISFHVDRTGDMERLIEKQT